MKLSNNANADRMQLRRGWSLSPEAKENIKVLGFVSASTNSEAHSGQFNFQLPGYLNGQNQHCGNG